VTALSAKGFTRITTAIDSVVAVVDEELGRQITPRSSGTSETDWIGLTPERRDRFATFHRKVLVLQEDWQYLKLVRIMFIHGWKSVVQNAVMVVGTDGPLNTRG
jgi:hypothetical protein